MNGKKNFILLSLAILLSQFVLADPFRFGRSSGFSFPGIWSSLVGFFDNIYFVAFVTFLLMFILLYAVLATGLNKVGAFSDGGKLTKNGNIVAVSMALLANFGIFGLAMVRGGVPNMLKRIPVILGTFSTLAGWAISILIAALVWFNAGEIKQRGEVKAIARVGLVLLTFGLTFWVFGTLFADQANQDFGLLFVVIGLILVIIGFFGRLPGVKGIQDIKRQTDIGMNDLAKERDNAVNAVKNAPQQAAENLVDQVKGQLEPYVNEVQKNLQDALNNTMQKLNQASNTAPEKEVKEIQGAGQATNESLKDVNDLGKTVKSAGHANEILKRINEALKSIHDAEKQNKKAGLTENGKKLKKSEDLLKQAEKVARNGEKQAEKWIQLELPFGKEMPKQLELEFDKEDKKIDHDEEKLAKRILLEKEWVEEDKNKTHELYNECNAKIESLKQIDPNNRETFIPNCKEYSKQGLHFTEKLLDAMHEGSKHNRLRWRNHRRAITEINDSLAEWFEKEKKLKAVHQLFKEKLASKINHGRANELLYNLMEDYKIIQATEQQLGKLKRMFQGQEVLNREVKMFTHDLLMDGKRLEETFKKITRARKTENRLGHVKHSSDLLQQIRELLIKRSFKLQKMIELEEVLRHYESDLMHISQHEEKFRHDLKRDMDLITKQIAQPPGKK